MGVPPCILIAVKNDFSWFYMLGKVATNLSQLFDADPVDNELITGIQVFTLPVMRSCHFKFPLAVTGINIPYLAYYYSTSACYSWPLQDAHQV